MQAQHCTFLVRYCQAHYCSVLGASSVIPGISALLVFPGSLRTDFRFHFKNLQVFQKLESFVSRASSFIFHLFFAILDLGTGSLNLLFLALHSIDPYLLGGWGLAFPCPSSAQMDLCPLQVTPLPLGLSKACKGCKSRNPASSLRSHYIHPSPAWLLSHSPPRVSS